MYTLTPVSKADLQLLKGFPEKIRMPALYNLYYSKRDVGQAVADAHEEGINVRPLVEEMFADGAVRYGLTYDNGCWFLCCFPVKNYVIRIREREIVSSRAKETLDHAVWHAGGLH